MILPPSQNHLKLSSTNTVASGVDVNVMCTHPSQNQQLSDILQPVDRENEWKLDSKRTISIESIRNESGHGNSGCTNGIIFNNGVSKDVNEIQRTQVQMQKNPAHQSQNGHQQLTHHFNSMNGGKSNGPNHLDINDHGSSKASSTSISVDSSNGGRIKTRTSNAPLPSRNSSCQSITEISSMPQSQSQLQSHIQMQLKQKLDFNHQFDTTLQSEPSTNGTIKTSSSCNDDIPNVQAGNTDASASGHTATTLLGITQMKDLKKQFRIQAERGRRNSSERIAIPTGMMTMMAKENNSGVDYAVGMAERGRRNSSERIAVSTEMMTMMAKGSNAGVGSSMRLLQAMDMQQQNQQQHRMRTQQQRIQMGMMTNDKDLPSEMLGSGQTTKRPWNGAMLPIGNVIATTSNNPTANISRGTSRSRLRLSKPSSMMMKMYENVSVTPPVPGENERRSMTNNDANSISDNNETIKAQLRNNIPPQPSSSSSSFDFSSPTKSHKTNWVASSIGLASSSSRRSLGSLDRNVFAVNPANDRVKVARSLGSFGSHRRSHSSIFKNPPKSMDDVLLSKWNAFSSNADWSVKIQPGNERMRQHQSCFSISHQPTRNPALQYAVLKSVEQYQYADDEASDVAVIGKQIRSNQGHDLSLDRKPSTINISKTSLPWGTLVESDTMTSSLLQPERKTSGLSVPKTSGKCHLNSGCSHDKVVNEAIDDAFELGVEHEFSNARDEFTGLDVKSESRINIERSLKGPMVARALQNGDGEDITGLEDKTSDCLTGTVRYGIDGSKQRPLKNGRKSPPMMTTTRLSRFTITENSDEIMPNAGWERDDFLTSYQDAELHCGFSQSSSSSSQRKQAHLGSLLIPSGHIEDSAWNEVLVEEEEATGCSNSNSGSSVSKKQLGHVSSKVIQCLDRKPSSVYLKQADDNMTLNASMLSTDCEPANTFTPFERRLSGLSVSGNSEMFLDSSAYGQYDIHCELPFEHAGVSCDVQGTGKKTVDVSSMPSKNGRQEVAGSAQSDIIKDMSRCLSNDDAGTNLPSNQLHSPSRQNQHENASMNNLNPLLANHMKLSSCRKASHPNLQSSGCSPPSNEFRQGVNSHRMASLSRPSLTNLVRWSSLLGKKSNADLQNSEWSVESCSKSRSSFASLVKKPSAMSRKTSKGNLQNETFSDNYEQPHHPIANASRPSLTSLLRKPSLLRGLKSSNNLQNATFELSTSSKKNGDIEQSQSRSTAEGEMTRTSSLNLIRKPLKKDSSAKRLVSLMRTNHDSDHGHGVSQKHHIPSPHGGLNRGNAGGDSFRRSCTVTHRCSSLCNDGDYEPAKLVDDIKRSGCCLPKLVAKIPTSSSFSRNAFGMKCYEKNEEWTDQQIDYHFEKALLEAKSALGVAIPPKGHRSSSRIGKSVPSRSLRRNLSEQFRNPGHNKKTDYTSTRSMHRSASQNFVGSEKFDSFRRPVRRHTSDITLGEDYPEKYARRRSFLLHRGSNNGPSPPISRRSSMNYDGEKNHRRSNINNNDKKVRRAFNLISRKKSIIRHSSAISTAAVVLMKRRASVESMNSSHTSQELEAVETFDLEDVFTELLRYDEECKKSKEARNGIFDWDKTRKALSANSDKKLRWKDFSHNNQAADSKKGNIFHLLCKHRPPHDILEQLLVFVHKSEMDNSLSKSRKHPREENRDHPSRTFLPPSHTPPGMQAKNPAKRTTWAEVLETRDENDRTPLHVAAASGCSLEALRALIHAHPPVASMTDRQGRSPLILAIMWYFDPTSLNIEEIDMTLRYSMELATLLEIIRIFKSTMTLHPGAAGVMDVDEFGLASFDYAIKGEASDEIIESLKSDDFHINRNQVNEDKGEDDDTPKKAAERRLSDKFYDEMDVQTTDKLNVDLSFSEDILEPWETESFEQAKQLLELAADKEYAEIEQFVELPPVEEISIIRLQDRVRRRFSESSLLSTFFRAVNHHTFGDDISEITLPAVLSYGID